jgi:hypothetical protein
MEPILDYYNINIIDIWPYERILFFNEKTTEERILLVEKKTIKLIIENSNLQENTSKVKPFTDLKRYDSGEHEGYWVQHLYQWDRAFNNVQERIALNYFLYQDSFYSFTQEIEINLTHEDFDFWFALKLNQYDSGLKQLNNFLDYHLKSTFRNENKKYNSFLQNVIMQFEEGIITKKIVQYVQSRINLYNDETNLYQLYTSEYRTFCFLELSKDSSFIQKGHVLVAVTELLNDLKKSGFIDPELKAAQFLKLFGTVRINNEERFKWLESNDTLKRFVLKIVNSGIIVGLPNKDKWLIVRDCFIRHKNKELFDYDPKKLENSSGNNSLLTDSLNKMTDDFIKAIEKTPN